MTLSILAKLYLGCVLVPGTICGTTCEFRCVSALGQNLGYIAVDTNLKIW
jgi:hypothetical protein